MSSRSVDSSNRMKSIAVKSQISRPVKSPNDESTSSVRDYTQAKQRSPVQSPESTRSINREIKSKIVQVGKDKQPVSSREDVKLKRAMKFGEDGEGLKKVRVVRKVAVTSKPLDTNDDSKKTSKDRRSLAIYKPPSRGGMWYF